MARCGAHIKRLHPLRPHGMIRTVQHQLMETDMKDFLEDILALIGVLVIAGSFIFVLALLI